MVSKATQKMHEIGYVPPTETWTPVNEALYSAETLFRLPKEKTDHHARDSRRSPTKISFLESATY